MWISVPDQADVNSLYKVTALGGGAYEFKKHDNSVTANSHAVTKIVTIGNLDYVVSVDAGGQVSLVRSRQSSTPEVGAPVMRVGDKVYAVTYNVGNGKYRFTDVQTPANFVESDVFEGTVTIDSVRYDLKVIDPDGNIRLLRLGKEGRQLYGHIVRVGTAFYEVKKVINEFVFTHVQTRVDSTTAGSNINFAGTDYRVYEDSFGMIQMSVIPKASSSLDRKS